MTGPRLAHDMAPRAAAQPEEETFFVLVPDRRNAGSYTAVYADGSQCAATEWHLSQAATA